jgi:hypothetical protein
MHDFDDFMFFLSVLLIQLCLVLIMWFVRTKNIVFKGLKGHFRGLTVCWVFSGLLGSVLHVIGKNIALVL